MYNNKYKSTEVLIVTNKWYLKRRQTMLLRQTVLFFFLNLGKTNK